MIFGVAGYLRGTLKCINWASISARDSPSPLGSVTNCARNQDAVTYRTKVVF